MALEAFTLATLAGLKSKAAEEHLKEIAPAA
jgi:hypothetical protein